MNKALFAQSAQADLLEAWLFIAEDDLGAADQVLDSIETESKMLATKPLMGRAPRAGRRRAQLADIHRVYFVLFGGRKRHHRASCFAPWGRLEGRLEDQVLGRLEGQRLEGQVLHYDINSPTQMLDQALVPISYVPAAP